MGAMVVIFLVGSGIFFLIFSGLRPFRYLPHAFALLTGKYSKESDVGDVSHFKALTAALGNNRTWEYCWSCSSNSTWWTELYFGCGLQQL